MTTPKLTVLIVNYNSADFIKMSLFALSKLTHFPYVVEIIDNCSEMKDYKKLIQTCQRYPNVNLSRENTNLRGSLAHGTALNKLAKKVKTPYFSILDADASWLIKDWDKKLQQKITDIIKIVGVQTPLPKTQGFPGIYAVFLETKTFKKLDINFCPQGDGSTKDTGWQLKNKYQKQGFQGQIIQAYSTRDFKDGPFQKVICAEYYLKNVDHIFASHFGRGSTQGEHKYRNTNLLYRIPFLSKLLRKVKGNHEKKLWLSICRRIINAQIS